MTCIVESTDFMYPLLADVYYPIVEQNPYGAIKKQWVLDRTIAIATNPAGRKFQQDVEINNAKLDINNAILGRTKNDLTESNANELFSLTNIILVNIRDSNGNLIYNESSGPRIGKSTIFEISTFNPIVGAFGTIEYFKLVIKRSDNQASDL
jgi:hypothetical protein